MLEGGRALGLCDNLANELRLSCLPFLLLLDDSTRNDHGG